MISGCLLSAGTDSFCDWGADNGYSSRGSISVTNSLGSALTDYQIVFNLNTQALVSAGKMNADGSDIRVLDQDDATVLSYWIETPTINTSSTRIWVKVPNLAASSTRTLNLYFGNTAAPATSSIGNTFLFGDDFPGAAVDGAKWSGDTGNFTVSGGYLNGTNTTYYIQSATSFSNPIIIETRTLANTLASNGEQTLGFWVNSSNGIGLLEHSGGTPSRYWYRNDGSWVGPTNYNFLTWHKTRISINSANSGTLYVINDSSQTTTQSFTNAVSNEKITLGRRYDTSYTGQAYNQNWDWIFARQYASTEPTVQVTLPITTLVYTTSAQTIYGNDVSSVITVQARDDTGAAQNVSADTTLNLSTTSGTGQFSATSSPFTATTSVTVPSGQSSVSFYYKDASPGSYALTAAESPSQGWTDAAQGMTVLDLGLGSYKAPVVITNSGASALTDHQVSFTFNSQALIALGKMKSDGSDIRVLDTDDVTPLNFWVETPTINTTQTIVWAKVPSIPASSTKTIYMYYGNPSAADLSSISNTFVFGDDFLGVSVNTSRWSGDTGNFTVSGGSLRGTNTSYYIQSATSCSNPIIIETRTRANTLASNGQQTLGFWVSSANGIGLLEHAGGTPSRYWYRNDGSWVGPYDYDFFSWHRVKISINAANAGTLYVINASSQTTAQSFTNAVSNEKITLGRRYDTGNTGQAYSQDWDWVFARKFASPEPSTAVNFPISKIVFTTTAQTLYQNYTSTVMTVQTQDETGASQNVSSNTTIALSSTSGTTQFSAAASPFTPVTSVTIPSGQNTVSFYCKDDTAGAWAVTAAESPSQGWTDATQVLTINDLGLGLYKAPLEITNSGAAQTDFQVSVTINTQALIGLGRLNADGSDIRFLDSDDLTPLSFWIETPTMATTQTVVWVKVPSLPASSTKTIYFYYGNPAAASLSSITGTFLFGDDFSGASVDTAKWSGNTGNFTVSGGYLNGTNTTYYIQSMTALSNPVIIETRTRNNAVANNGQQTLGFWESSSNGIGLLEHAGGTPSRYWYRNNSSWVGPYDYDFFNWHRVRIRIDASNSGELYVLNPSGTTATQTFSNTVSNERIALGRRYDTSYTGQTYNQDWDWVFARKYAATEPPAEIKFPISKLAFTTDAQTVLEDRVSSVITVQAQDETGTTRPVSSDTAVRLSSTSSSGRFSLNASPFSSVSSVTIPAGQSSASFYYRDSTLGTFTISAAESPSQGWTPAQQSVTVMAVSVLGSYKRPVTVTNSAAAALTNYQVLLTVNTQALISAGKMKTDGGDIRFLDSDDVTALPFWIETPTINTTQTRLWIKVPDISALSSKTIYMYYGNSGASSASSITNTFLFGDDFSGVSLDTTKWSGDTSRFAVSGGYMNGTNTTYFIQSATALSNPVIIETRTRANTLANNGQQTLGFWVSSANGIGLLEHAGGTPSRYWYRNDGSWVGPYNYNFLGWHKARIRIDSANSGDLYAVNELGATTTQTFTNTVSGEKITLGRRYDVGYTAQTYNQDWDWVFARKYAAVEPATAAGTEQSTITKLAFVTASETLLQNASSSLITLQAQDASNNPVGVSTDIQVVLTSSSAGGRFAPSGSPSSWSASNTQTLSIAAGEYAASFYYKDSDVGSPVITAREFPSMGWLDATKQYVVISRLARFDVTAASPQTAGVPFELTIAARDQDNAVVTTYTGPALLTLTYVSPAAGTFLLTPAQAANFSEGVAVVSCLYDDCGTISVTVTDSEDAQKTGRSPDIFFAPYALTAEASAEQTVSQPFSLTVTATNASGQLTPNYAGPVTLTFTEVSPATPQGGTLSPLTATAFSGGIATLTNVVYDRWGSVIIKVSDQADPLKTGQTPAMMFRPRDLLVEISNPPADRPFFYIGETLQAAVTARDATLDRITNYFGTVTFTVSGSVSPPQAPYTFVASDAGTRTFSFQGTREEDVAITVSDSSNAAIFGTGSGSVRYGKIVVEPNQGPVGEVLTQVKVLDSSGEVIRSDNSTVFTVSLKESIPNGSALCDAAAASVAITRGEAIIAVRDAEAERVNVTPASDPVLDQLPGDVDFGSIGSTGIRILLWREKK